MGEHSSLNGEADESVAFPEQHSEPSPIIDVKGGSDSKDSVAVDVSSSEVIQGGDDYSEVNLKPVEESKLDNSQPEEEDSQGMQQISEPVKQNGVCKSNGVKHYPHANGAGEDHHQQPKAKGTIVRVESIRDSPKCDKKKNQVGCMRHIIAVLGLTSIILANMNRQAFNQALVSMTRDIKKPIDVIEAVETVAPDAMTPPTTLPPQPPPTGDLIDADPTASSDHITASTSTDQITSQPVHELDDRFDWTPQQIALLQAAFSYGYTPFMIPGGRMSELYGAKWVVLFSSLGSALCCMLAPLLADMNYHLLVASRVLMGLSQTGVSPALYALLSRWLPSDESSLYLPMIKVGVQLGFMAGSLFSGFFAWRMTFYSVGFIGVLWSMLWFLVVSSEPSGNKFLSEPELKYIKRELRKQNKRSDSAISTTSADEAKRRRKSAPWWAILTNPVVVAFMFAKFTVKFSTDTQTMQIPMYLAKVFHVSKELNGTLSALNFAIQGIFTGLLAWLAKEAVTRRTCGLSKTGVRRLFQGSCNFGMALSYVLITLNMGSLELVCCAVILLSITSMFGAGGEPLTPLDLSIEYSASIMAIANSTANLSGILLPQIVSFVLAGDLTNPSRWNLVLIIIAGVVTFGGMLYCCLVTAEQQDFEGEDANKSKGGVSKQLDKTESTSIEMVAVARE